MQDELEQALEIQAERVAWLKDKIAEGEQCAQAVEVLRARLAAAEAELADLTQRVEVASR